MLGELQRRFVARRRHFTHWIVIASARVVIMFVVVAVAIILVCGAGAWRAPYYFQLIVGVVVHVDLLLRILGRVVHRH